MIFIQINGCKASLMVNPFWICPASYTLYIHPILCARLLDSFSAPWSIAGTPHFSIPTPVIGSRVSQRLSPLHNLVSCKASGSGEDVVIWSNPLGLAWSHFSSSFGFNSSLGIIKHIRSISFWKHLKNLHSAGTTKQATFDTDVRHGRSTRWTRWVRILRPWHPHFRKTWPWEPWDAEETPCQDRWTHHDPLPP